MVVFSTFITLNWAINTLQGCISQSHSIVLVRNKKDDEMWQVTIPVNYFIQVIHYLNVMNDYDGAILVARLRFFDYYNEDGKKLLRTETRYYYIDRKDEEVQKQMIALEKVETKFWEENVLKRVPPKTTIKI